MRKMAMRHGVIFWVLMAAGYYLMVMAGSGETMPEVDAWVLVVLVLPALALAVLGMRRLLKFRGQWENLFFTLTEGGLLYESERAGMSMFLPWSEVTMARRSGSVVSLFLKSGQAIPCFLEGVSEQRQREFFRYALERVGKGCAADCTPPPAAEMVGEPLRYSATKVQRREVADTMMMVEAPGRLRVFRPLVFLLWVVLFAHACYEAEFTMMAVCLVLLISTAYFMWHPGARYNRRKEGVGADVYVDGDSYLAVKDNGSWVAVRNVRVTLAAKLKYCDFYAFDNGGSLALDMGQPRPAQWPESCGKLRRRRSGGSMTLLVLLAVLVGLFAFSNSRQYHLYNAVNRDEPLRHLEALTGKKAADGVTFGLHHNFADIRWLKRKNPQQLYDVCIIVCYPDGSSDYVYLDARGRELARNSSVDLSSLNTYEFEGGAIYTDENANVVSEDIYATEQ